MCILIIGKQAPVGGGLVASWTLTYEEEVVVWGAFIGPFMVGAWVGSKVRNLDGLAFGNSLFLGAAAWFFDLRLGLIYLVMVAGITG